MTILSVNRLKTEFQTPEGWKVVVDDIGFDISANETLAVVGESGSGKSVTALSLMGLLPEKSSRVTGSALLEGQDLLRMPEHQRAKLRGSKIAMIFQEPMSALNPVMTIGRQIAEPLIRHRGLSRSAARAEVLRLMDRVRIPAPARRAACYPHEMSGGMLQRVMIATALACAPRLLIADEPTTALDVTVQGEILALIRELQQEDGMGVLFITHDMGVVAEIADKTLVMFRSKQVESGPTEQIFAAPKEAYTRRLIAAAPRLGELAHSPLPHPYQVEGDVPRARADTVQHDAPLLLSVKNLTTRFAMETSFFGTVRKRLHAVEDLSFDLRKGETLSLIGESGCGKSTTGRSILRLIEPTGGEILLNGVDLRKQGKSALMHQRLAMQMIFQDPFSSLNPRIRIGEAVAEPMLAHGVIGPDQVKDEVARLLSLVGLAPEMAERWPHEFSGGQRQRIAIARALGLRPEFIVADESVSALDVTIKAQVVNLLMELQEKFGLGYLFISHDMAVVERISHRVAVMRQGEIVEIGPRQSVFNMPSHPYTRRLMDAVPIPDPARRLMPRQITHEEVRAPIHDAHYTPPPKQWREVAPDHFILASSLSESAVDV